MRAHLLIGLVAAALSFTAHAERIRVLTAGAFLPVASELAPGFELRTGHQVDIVTATAGELVRRVDAGEAFDVLVVTAPAVQAYALAHKLVATAPLASSGIGVAVKAGAPLPPLKTAEQFRQMLVDAKHVAYISPTSGGSSGIYLATVFDKLGVADQVKGKAVLVNGGAAGQKLLDGEADVALQMMSELMAVPGITVAGPLPDELQRYTAYAGGVNPASRSRAAADAFMALLGSADAVTVIRARGLRADR